MRHLKLVFSARGVFDGVVSFDTLVLLALILAQKEGCVDIDAGAEGQFYINVCTKEWGYWYWLQHKREVVLALAREGWLSGEAMVTSNMNR